MFSFLTKSTKAKNFRKAQSSLEFGEYEEVKYMCGCIVRWAHGLYSPNEKRQKAISIVAKFQSTIWRHG